MRHLLLILLLLNAGFARAETLNSDAFGFFQGEDQTRQLWSGYSEVCEDGQCAGAVRATWPVFSIEEFFGQKSLRVASESAMAVGVYEDQYGNLVQEGTAQLHAEDGGFNQPTTIKEGISFSLVPANNIAKIETTSLSTIDQQSTEQTYRKIPDIPSVIPVLEPQTDPVGQGDIMAIQTQDLVDQYGNQAPLGLFMAALLIDEKGRYSWQPIVLQHKSATEIIETVAMHGNYQVSLSLGERNSPTENFLVEPEKIVGLDFDKTVIDPATNTIVFEIRSILTEHGHLMQDAVPLKVTLEEANGRVNQAETWTIDGGTRAIFALDENAFPLKLKLTSDFGSIEQVFNEKDVVIQDD